MLPVYCRLKFSPRFWSFTFPWSAIAALALTWLHIERPAGQTAYSVVALTATSLLTGAIAAQSLVAIARGQFLLLAAGQVEPVRERRDLRALPG
ncbi:MAG: family transporter [Actinomycetia bacterium]|nr:family transporter [Actinomycetes bacterium]